MSLASGAGVKGGAPPPKPPPPPPRPCAAGGGPPAGGGPAPWACAAGGRPPPWPCAQTGSAQLSATAAVNAPVATDRRIDITPPLKQDGSVCAVALEKLELLVTELELSDEARRIAVARRKRRDLEDLARLDRFLVHARSRQHLDRGGGQNPLRDRAVGVLHAEVQVRVRIDEIQFEELALEDDFLVEVVRAGYGVMCLRCRADREKSAQRDRPNNPFVHRCSSRVEETPADPSMCRRGRKRPWCVPK